MKKQIMVARSSMPPFEEYVKEIQSLWDTAWLTNMGRLHKEFEEKLVSFLKVPYISLFCNGHLSLELLLQALKLEGEVITTPFTFISTTHAIVRNGLTPIFCDINKDNYTINVDQIEKLITKKTSAILPVHVYGHVCDTKAIEEIANKYNLKVIYDAAHAFGVTIDGEAVGTFGDASIFSFHATKVFNTIEGGAVTFHDENIGKELYKLKNFGIQSETVVDGVGVNAKMNEFQAAMGICNLRHIDGEVEKRKKVVDRYFENLENIDGLCITKEQKNVKSNYSYFPIVIDETKFGITRDEIYDELRKENIYARKYFYPLTNQFQCYKGKFDKEQTPIAKYISERVLTLPLYANLELDDVDLICNFIKSYKTA
ncbi:DegT/DnrJ/EryC1/StrS family aminotransferase [Anaerocolumna aminovalerica]|jgi:dTDP-4-amino-4,6-dideoxygalactose transaminase|nr:DegT/DnrJ/EryC1/StrS family aminotransferase [Anaerocolumna aminovalerica]MBU5332228.1 DegT/DnrJ/EryC1/StrS family aminotransferase [Anaerocolumna aminovalerica]